MHIAITYASEHGSSAQIAHFMQQRIINNDMDCTLFNVMDERDIDLHAYDAAILGAPIYKGIWHPRMLRFILHNGTDLRRMRLYAWIACVRVLEEGGMSHVLQHYIPDELRELPISYPFGIFAGRLHPDLLTEDERWALYLRYDGAALMSELNGDFRDWDAIGAWTDGVMADLQQM